MISSSTLTYSVIGAILFSILGVIATYYRNDKPTGKSIGRDFIGGSVIVFILYLFVPKMFPELSFTIPGITTLDEVMSRRGGGDYDLQL
jgi:hypothetical protein